MSSPLSNFDLRKIEVRDIISSFSRTTLPSEFKPHLYSRIHAEQSLRPSTEWTLPADLEGTLMQWGVHHEGCREFLSQCQPAEVRAILFFQKAKRRLDIEFRAYDDLPLMDSHGETVDLSPSRERAEVRNIAERLREIIAAFMVDQEERQVQGDSVSRLRPLVETLRRVCSDADGGPESRRTRRLSGSQSGGSLFQELILRPGPNEGHFMLDLLDRFGTDALRAFREDLEAIGERLQEHNAPLAYRSKFQNILSRLTTPTTGAPPSPPHGPPPGNGDGSGGGKRRAAAEPPARRGRRKTGK